MLTNTQVSQFRKWAQSQGFSEIEIANEIARKNQEVAKQSIQKEPTQQQQMPQQQKQQSMSQLNSQQQNPSMLQKAVSATANFLIPRATAMVNKVKSTIDIDKYQRSLQSTNDRLYEQSRALLAEALKTKDPIKKKQLLDQSRELDFAASTNTEKFSKQLDEFQKITKITGNETPKDKLGYYGREFIGLAGEGAMWALPIGKAVQGAVIIKGMPLVTKILQGSITGGLQSGIYNITTPEDVTIGERIDKTIKGSLIGSIIGGTIPAVSGMGQSALNGVKSYISNKAAQGYGKASPSIYQKAIQEHGIDLNKIIEKYVPAGAGYDKMLGKANDRGSGGIIGERMLAAEKSINDAIKQSGSTIRVSGSDVIKELTKQQRSLKQTVGNKTNIEALNAIIKETKELFKNGVTAKKLLSIKRAADNKFGSAIVDESTGSVSAQAQKVLANFARSKLKTILPTVKKALDEETELYTLKEVLNRARGTLSTQGSEIRVGQFQGLLDLVNPFKYGSAVMNNPNLSSTIMKVTSQKKPLQDAIAKSGIEDAGTLSQKIIDTIVNTVKKGSFTQLEGSNGTKEQSGILDKIIQEEGIRTKQDEEGTQQDEIIQIQNEETGEIKNVKKSELYQYGLGEQNNQNQGMINKKDIVMAMIADLEMTGGKNIPELETILKSYESVFEEEEETNKLKLTDSAIKVVTELKGALKDVQSLQKSIGSSDIVGPLKGLRALNPYDVDAKSLQAEIDRIRQVVGKALEGGVLRKEDEEKYKKILPIVTDTREVALNKLRQLYVKIEDDLKSYVDLQREYGKGRGQEAIMLDTK